MSVNVFNDFINENVAPYMASSIGVFNSNGELVGKIPLNNFKPNETARHLLCGFFFVCTKVSICKSRTALL